MRFSSSVVLVLVTCPTRAVARRIAVDVVRRRLAACVNIVPGVESFFRWAGKVDRANEALLVMKTAAPRYPRLEERIVALHPYEVPEVIAVPLRRGFLPYLQWVRSSVVQPRSPLPERLARLDRSLPSQAYFR